ncbi:hypothetical protein PoB_004999600 [Plakobranchus ocellatus]|uniref:Uncharacterized protein n=1 Tax=Plakobranchus ocellatus TaxID=259542 RepID=A0AAV4BWL1_9GAST|nr:hypothetical protein PoB_004999600 [Plakobranchus ocellatus]
MADTMQTQFNYVSSSRSLGLWLGSPQVLKTLDSSSGSTVLNDLVFKLWTKSCPYNAQRITEENTMYTRTQQLQTS